MCPGSRPPPAPATKSTRRSTRASSASRFDGYERYRTEPARRGAQPIGMARSVVEARTAASPVLSKIATGIEGFDEISRGGLPRNRTSLVMGGPGTGKTVFALQTLVNAAQQRQEPGLFVAFEERTEAIFANAASFGWRLAALARGGLAFHNAQLSPSVVQSGEFDLSGMLAILEARKRELGAGWIVFDGIDV